MQVGSASISATTRASLSQPIRPTLVASLGARSIVGDGGRAELAEVHHKGEQQRQPHDRVKICSSRAVVVINPSAKPTSPMLAPHHSTLFATAVRLDESGTRCHSGELVMGYWVTARSHLGGVTRGPPDTTQSSTAS